MIHPTAIIHPKAKLDSTVTVGPYAVIGEGVTVGANCAVGPYVHMLGETTIGKGNHFHTGCVIGDTPQDLKYHGEPTRLRIGDENVFREHVTIHRSNKPTEDTVIGSNNFFMQHSHAAHNCVVGNHVIIAGGALLAGHAVVQDRAFISGNCMVHQFTRVGTLSMMQGGAAISKDLPPFCIAFHQNEICGLNIVGLRRGGIPPEERLELKRLYHALFRGGKNLRAAVEKARDKFSGKPAKMMLDFVGSATRGVCTDRGLRHEPGED
ncbi:MAG TPA: acyl-ACP--UDP-N-acetylglucosamine O-acyltransferase [Verrucomicrobiae bacterium]|jgi:UDP-N-acetylglucosamine acyltransferase|nr:acyl-ACP--UDP-N-acetylglucosamine O-acyltransferase [Verrucomicrobiae bacterium]